MARKSLVTLKRVHKSFVKENMNVTVHRDVRSSNYDGGKVVINAIVVDASPEFEKVTLQGLEGGRDKATSDLTGNYGYSTPRGNSIVLTDEGPEILLEEFSFSDLKKDNFIWIKVSESDISNFIGEEYWMIVDTTKLSKEIFDRLYYKDSVARVHHKFYDFYTSEKPKEEDKNPTLVDKTVLEFYGNNISNLSDSRGNILKMVGFNTFYFNEINVETAYDKVFTINHADSGFYSPYMIEYLTTYDLNIVPVHRDTLISSLPERYFIKQHGPAPQMRWRLVDNKYYGRDNIYEMIKKGQVGLFQNVTQTNINKSPNEDRKRKQEDGETIKSPPKTPVITAGQVPKGSTVQGKKSQAKITGGHIGDADIIGRS